MTTRQRLEFKKKVAWLDKEGLAALLERLKQEQAPLGMIMFVAKEYGKR